MTAARSDLMALADAVMCDLFPKGSTLDRSITADRAWEDLRTDIRKSLEVRLAASLPDREAVARALARAQSPTALTAYDAGAGLAVSYWNMQADAILSLLSGADEELVLPGETRIYESGKGRMPRPSDPSSSPDVRGAAQTLKRFADLFRDGAHGCDMGSEAAKSLALAIDSLLSGEHKNEADSNRTND